MLNWVQRSLKVKLILMFSGIIVIIVASIGMFSYYEVSKTIKTDIVKFSSQILKQANLNLERYYNGYEQDFLLLGTSEEFENWLRLDKDERISPVSYLQPIRDNYILPFQLRHPEILSITLKSHRGSEIHHTTKLGLALGYSMDQESWFSEIEKSDKVYTLVGMNDHYIDQHGAPIEIMSMTLAKVFYSYNNKGYLKMDISLGPAQSILSELELGEHSIGLISDKEGRIIVHPDLEQINQSLNPNWIEQIYSKQRGSFFVEDTDEIVVFETIPYTQWKTIAIVNYPSVAGSVDRLRTATLVIAMAGIVCAVILVVLVTSSFASRITNLRRMMKRMKIGDFKQRVEVKGKDELADLGLAYNQMLENLEDSVHQLTESKMQQQRAVLSALQSQINSHFLYNTLESINSMAILADHQDIEQTTVNLSNMLRYISTYQDVIVTLNDEIKHMENYFSICKIRYGDSLTYEIDMDAECALIPCLKAILQPIAENAIKHGLEKSGEHIHLRIQVRRMNEQVFISVQDNGEGFSKEVLQKLQVKLSKVDQTESYATITQVGILNVQYRLKMFYLNKPAGISVHNIPPKGAKVDITFPATEKKEVRINESNSDSR